MKQKNEKQMGTKEEDWLWICSVPGLYRKSRQALLDYFGSPKEVKDAPETEMRSFKGIKEETVQSILRTRSNWDIQKVCHALQEKEIEFISCEDLCYPEKLKAIYDYPHGLFVKGRLPEQEEKMVAIVGARNCSAYGRYVAKKTAEELAAYDVSVISGMARGIDGNAQKSMIRAGGKSFAVLGCGVDICYPQENWDVYQKITEKGGILSEYPPAALPLNFHFPMRNRIISGLADMVIVVEARKKSGSLITADQALEQGKEVAAVPGRVGDRISEGCNHLIEQGASVFLSTEQILERIGVETKRQTKRKKTNLTLESEENLVYSVLEFQTKNLQSIVNETGLAPQKVNAILVRLTLRGLITEDIKNHYAKI